MKKSIYPEVKITQSKYKKGFQRITAKSLFPIYKTVRFYFINLSIAEFFPTTIRCSFSLKT